MNVAALVVAIVAALAAVGSFLYARRLDERAKDAVAAAQRSATAAEQSAVSAERSAIASEARAELEGQRRRAELTPRFRVTFERWTGKLLVRLTGPAELGRLDLLIVSVRDDRPGRAEDVRPGGPSEEEIAAQIWGLYRFIPGSGPGASPDGEVRGADPTGRVVRTAGMAVGEELVFAMEMTGPPGWSAWSMEDWGRQQGTVIRLQMKCRREGMEPWSLPCEIDSVGGKAVEVP